MASIPPLALLYAARNSPTGGIAVRTPDPNALRTILYRARKASGDPSLSGLTIRTSPLDKDHEILILQSTDPNPGVPDGQG